MTCIARVTKPDPPPFKIIGTDLTLTGFDYSKIKAILAVLAKCAVESECAPRTRLK